MPQATLPLFTSDMTIVNLHVGVQKRNGIVYYFNGALPFHQHREGDRESFKNIVCQLIKNGRATRQQISDSFQIPARSISRWLETFDKEGDGCFFRKKKLRTNASSQPKKLPK